MIKVAKPVNFTNKPFEIRYVELDSSLIFNQCGPHSAGPKGWTEEAIAQREKDSQRWIDAMNRRNQFYIKLEKSIQEQGIRNPILVRAGWIPQRKIRWLPPHMEKDSHQILCCDANGGSRLWIAQKYNLRISCIVSDFVGRFKNEKLLTTEQDIRSCYADPPEYIDIIDGHGVRVRNLPQIHLQLD